MDTAKANTTNKYVDQTICNRQIPCSREHGKLCFCQTKQVSSAKNLTCPPCRSGRFPPKSENVDGYQIINR